MPDSHCSIPVLMYHHVNPEGNFINVRASVFEKQMRFLKEQGYTTVHTGDYLSVMRGERLPPRKPVMITFDDGWLDNWIFAYPVLKQYGLKAVVFVITSLIEDGEKRKRADEGNGDALPVHRECMKLIEKGRHREVMLSWDEVMEMESSGLIEFQPHTHTHQRWDKQSLDSEELKQKVEKEILLSREILQDRLNKTCSALCWPWGYYTDEYVRIARAAGFELLFTTGKGGNTSGAGPYNVKRLVIGNITPMNLGKKLFIHSRPWLSRAYLRFFH